MTVWLLVTPLLVMLLAGISLDLSAATAARGRIAAIADEAAVAGAAAISPRVVRDDAQDVVVDTAAAVAIALAAVDRHPDAGHVVARHAAVQGEVVSVTVEGRFEFLLLRLVGVGGAPIRVTGHAVPVVD